MGTIITDVDSWVIALTLAAAMSVGWGIGIWCGRQLVQRGREAPPSKFGDVILALVGLLLGFTFSMSLSKHDQRRLMVVADSNSIGDFYTCASLVKEPVRSKLQNALRAYTGHRLALARTRLTEADLEKGLHEIQQAQNTMQSLVGEALESGTPIAVPLVNTYNEVTSNHASRLAAVRDRLPPIVILLLVLAAVLAMVLAGVQQGASKERHWAAPLGFIVLVAMIFWVLLDLNQPHRGMITVSQEPMERLLEGMGKSP